MYVTDKYKEYSENLNPLIVELQETLGIKKCFTKAQGHTLEYIDELGNKGTVIDAACGYGSLIFGHNHPEIVAVAQNYLNNNGPVHSQFSIRPEAAELAKLLTSITKKYTGKEYIARFANSGAESVDLAIKHCEFKRVLKMQELLKKQEKDLIALEKEILLGNCTIPADIFSSTELRERVFGKRLSITELRTYLSMLNAKALQARPLLFALKNSFHGKTIGASQLTYSETYRKAFLYFGLMTFFIDPNDIMEIELILEDCRETFFTFEIINGEVSLLEKDYPITTAVIAEPIQGEGGIVEIDAMALQDLRMICDELEVPLIFDEIQSGMGRTGSFFASQESGVVADLYLIAKSIGGGITKNSAVLIRKDQYEKAFGIIHSSTFAEDGLSAAVGHKVLEMLERDNGLAYKKAMEIGNSLIDGLKKIQNKYPGVIKEIRGKGLMLGVEFEDMDIADSVVMRSLSKSEIIGYCLFSYLQENEMIRAIPTASASSTLRLEPGVTLTDKEVQMILKAFDSLAKILYNNDGYHLVKQMTSQDRRDQSVEVINYKTNEFKDGIESYKSKDGVPRIGFIGHIMDLESIGTAAPELERLTISERKCMYDNAILRINTINTPVRVRSQQGKEVDIILYMINKTSAQLVDMMMGKDKDLITDAIYDIAKESFADGCQVLGFGGFSSIVTNNCKSISQVKGLPYTSGNALTTGLGYRAMLVGAEKQNLRVSDCCAAVVGGAGNIGQVYASLLAESVSKLTLVGSQRKGSMNRLKSAYRRIYNDIATDIYTLDFENLTGIAAELINDKEIEDFFKVQKEAGSFDIQSNKFLIEFISKKYEDDPFIKLSDDLSTLREQDLIACTTNAPESFIGSDLISPNTIICDLGAPLNVKQEVIERDDIEFMQGGLAQLPGKQAVPQSSFNVPEGTAYGCLTETIVMGMLGMRDHYSYGDITRDQVKEITAIADGMGFKVADQYRVGKKF